MRTPPHPSPLVGMTDQTLVGLVAGGSDDAFAALHERYHPQLVRHARGVVSGDTAAAEDAVQEAMVRAVRALRDSTPPEAVGPWLHRIVRNCALDLSAARRRRAVVELLDHAHPPSEDPHVAIDRRHQVRGLLADVARLPHTQRSAIVLRELEGRSYAAIADELEVTVTAVKSLLVRARTALRAARDARRVGALLASASAEPPGRHVGAAGLWHDAEGHLSGGRRGGLRARRRARQSTIPATGSQPRHPPPIAPMWQRPLREPLRPRPAACPS